MQQRGVHSTDQVPGGLTPAGCSSPGTGQILPDATLPAADGTSLSLDRYSGRRNLVVVLLGACALDNELSRLLPQLARSHATMDIEEAEVLVVAAGDARELASSATYPFPILVDRDEAFHRCLGSVGAAGAVAPAVIITDRFREIYHIFRPIDPEWPPTADDIASWLVFMNIQCPECGAPEW